MDQYLLFAIVGLGFGSVYAALSMGLVIVYRGTGIINFATGAMAMWGAYVFDELRRTGDMVLPVVIIKHRFGLGGADDSVPFLTAMVLAVLSCSLIGAMVHFFVFRPLRRAPILARVVASVGVLLVIQALIVMHFTSGARAVEPILPNEPVSLAGISFSRDRLWLAAIVVVTAGLAWAWFRFTRTGLATRASTENERAISLARYSPQALAGSTWVLSATVVGFLIILTAPTVTLNPLTYVLAIVPALAAAVIGRLLSIVVTVTAAFALGVFQSIAVLQTTYDWWPDWAITGLAHALPFGVIVIALFGLGRSLPARGSVETNPLPTVVRPKMRPTVVVAVVAGAAVAVALTGGAYRNGLITTMIMTIVMLSLVVLTGLVGQISLAQAAIAGAAGFTLSKLGDTLGVPFPLSMILAALVATAFGVLVGVPALRIRGAQLAVVTLSGAVALEEFVFRNPALTGVFGNPITGPTLFGWNLGPREGRNFARIEFGILVLVVVSVCVLLVGNLARSATGRRFLAVRSNERAGASVGISVARTKLVAFGVSSFFAGVGGAFIGYSRGQLSAESFAVLIGLSFLALAYLCGITSVVGAIIAGVFAPLGIGYVVADRTAELGRWYQFLAGIALVLTAIFFPDGIAGAYRQNLGRLKALRAGRRARAAARRGLETEGGLAAVNKPLTTAPEVSARPARPVVFDDKPVVLEAAELTVRYGGLRAVDQVSLRIRKGEIVGLIGPNGAGKTTLVDALTGFVSSRGRISYCGDQIQHDAPHRRARAGIARTWQSLESFDDLTVRENIQVAAERPSLRSVLVDMVRPSRPSKHAVGADVDATLALLDLTDAADLHPRNLPLGRQKLVGVARSLAGDPRVVLADEPAAGLSPVESRALGRRLVDIAADGVAILLIDHDMDLVLDVCDYVYVLASGRIIAEGNASQIRSNEAVIDAYLGSEVRVQTRMGAQKPTPEPTTGPTPDADLP